MTYKAQNLEQKEQNVLPEVAARRPARPDRPGGRTLENRLSSEQARSKFHKGGEDKLEQEEQTNVAEAIAPEPARDYASDREWHGEKENPSADFEDKPVEPQTTPAQRKYKLITQLYVFSWLIFFSILGALARLGVQWLTFYPGAPVTVSNLWANLGGSIFMGFLSQDKKLFEVPTEVDRKHGYHSKKVIPLYIGLTTGFCGSFTSFSTFMRDAFNAIANNVPTPKNHPTDPDPVTSTASRNGGYSVLAVMAIIILTLAVNISALKFGAHLSMASHRITPTLPYGLMRRFLDPLGVFLAFGCWIGAIIMAIWPPDRPNGPASRGSWENETWRAVILPLVFAPPGCILRFLLAAKLNDKIPSFPLGTFAANMFGTAVQSTCYSIQHVPLGHDPMITGGGRVACQVLQGIEDGFDGCLTTISTFMVELTTLKKRHAYVYGATSIAVGISIVVVIIGSTMWTVGFRTVACVLEVS